MVDRGGMLWLGGQFRGVTITDPRGTRFRIVLDISAAARCQRRGGDSVRGMAQDAQRRTVGGTDDARLLRYHLQDDRFDDFTDRLPNEAGAPAPRVLAVTPDADAVTFGWRPAAD